MTTKNFLSSHENHINRVRDKNSQSFQRLKNINNIFISNKTFFTFNSQEKFLEKNHVKIPIFPRS
jgi:hypothetical protein